MPHNRAQCGTHVFSTTPSTSNAAHCPKCYCYVCDVEVDECTAWGPGAWVQTLCLPPCARQCTLQNPYQLSPPVAPLTAALQCTRMRAATAPSTGHEDTAWCMHAGSSDADHCNAHAGEGRYQATREQHRGERRGLERAFGAAAAEGTAAEQANDLDSEGTPSPEDDGGLADWLGAFHVPRDTLHRQPSSASGSAGRRPQKVAIESVPAAAIMPDPRRDASMMLLGTVTLPFEVLVLSWPLTIGIQGLGLGLVFQGRGVA